MKCPRCQSDNQDSSRFCGTCGAELAPGGPAQLAPPGPAGPAAVDLTPGELAAGKYRIIEEIGRGGMGIVYKAEDTTLGRRVAVKILPDAFAADPESLDRFEREARILASLDHPNIAAVYGIEEAAGRRLLVLELVEGETLARALCRGPLSLAEALDICRQTADALEAAHGRGIIHRDLKPSNLKITPEGKVKVLDFGLARSLPGGAAEAGYLSSPTITADMTRSGVILGTAAYMSPEQAKGKAVDKRADIWSFGCILYECLTGRRAFQGDSITEVLAAVLTRDPDWQALPPETPAAVRRLLKRCLSREPSRRLGDIHDAGLEIGDAEFEPAPTPSALAQRGSRTRRFVLLTAAVAVGLTVPGVLLFQGLWHWKTPARTPPVMRFALPGAFSPGRPIYPSLDLSPDGTRLVVDTDRGGPGPLILRSLDQLEPTTLDGTENAEAPFFSPDGERIGFFADGKLKTVAVTGGAPAVVCEVPRGFCGSWGADGTIVFTPNWGYGLMRVPAGGGKPATLTTPDPARGEVAHLWPQVLSDGRAVLFTNLAGDVTRADDANVAVQVEGEAEPRLLVRGGSFGRYVASGHLLYLRRGALLAVPFDIGDLQVRGAPVAVLDGLQSTDWTGVAHFAVSGTGTLVYAVGEAYRPDDSLARVDLRGAVRPLLPEKYVSTPAFSPDGRWIAVRIAAANDDIWILDPDRGLLTRFTLGFGDELHPVWTPDGKHIIYSQGRTSLFWKAADGSGEPEPLLTGESQRAPGSVSPDGSLLAYSESGPQTRGDIWLMPLVGERRPRRFLATPFNETSPQFSPNGRWIAYVSDESGREEVYLQAVGAAGGKRQVSISGGTEPAWSRAGSRLFFLEGKTLLAVEVDPASGAPGPIEPLFELSSLVPGAGYDVASDDTGFVMVVKNDPPPATELRIVLNWFEELSRLAPAGK